MSKTVREVEFKFYHSYMDALHDKVWFRETLDVEDNNPQENVSLGNAHIGYDFRLVSVRRERLPDKPVEQVYIKLADNSVG